MRYFTYIKKGPVAQIQVHRDPWHNQLVFLLGWHNGEFKLTFTPWEMIEVGNLSSKSMIPPRAWDLA